MSKLRYVFYLFFLILVVTTASTFWLRTPDSDYKQLQTRYLNQQSQFITLESGQRIHFRDTGDKRKPAILMIHGTSDSLLTWDAIASLIGDQYRLISLDLPGHGFSSPPLKPSFDSFTVIIVELLKHLQIESTTLMGNSLGGGIAWRVALQQEELIDRLILLSPSGAPRKQKSKSNLGFRILANPIGRFLAQNITPRIVIEKSLLGSVSNPELVTQDLIDRYWLLLRLPGNRAALSNLATLPRQDKAWNNINQIIKPTLIVWGEDDQIIPLSSAQEFIQSMPQATILTYSKIGHLPMIEAPKRLAADINRFMSDSTIETN